MNKISIMDTVKAINELYNDGYCATLIGIGPMSERLLKASFLLAKEKDFPLMFIASRNQVDLKELGGGYVCNWDQAGFVKAIDDMAEKVDFHGLYYKCRDHGGPWQRDNERNSRISEKQAMEMAKKSYLEDLIQGFDLLHIDPTKDPDEIGKVIPLDVVIRRTVELIEFVENERIKRKLPIVGYEVGTEETNGGLTSSKIYELFIRELKEILERKGLPTPLFIVGQTGTLTRLTKNIGKFSFENALDLTTVTRKYKMGLKEHNGDYLSDDILLEHLPLGITAMNVAPEFGTVETQAYLELIKVEKTLNKQGQIENPSNLYKTLTTEAVKSEKWRKWMVGENSKLDISEVLKNNQMTNEITEICGHYTFNNESVKKEISKMFSNLASFGVDGDKYVVNSIKASINRYINCFNLEGITSEIKNNKNRRW